MATEISTAPNGNYAGAKVTPDPPTLKCATLANVALTGVTTPDGQTMADGDVYLAAGQTVAANCGVYVYQSGGAHTRHPAFTTSAQFVAGLMPITAGTYANLVATYCGQASPVVGTDALKFSISQSKRTYDRFVGGSGGTDTTGTYTIPAGNYSKIIIRGTGSGGPGGSGAKSAAGTAACGGGGGGGAALTFEEFDYATFTAAQGFSITYIVGGSVDGAAGVTADGAPTTVGLAAADGRDTTATCAGGRIFLASGGNHGSGGTAATGTHGTGGTGMINGTAGGDAGATGVAGSAGTSGASNGLSCMACTGGGGGGGVNASTAAANGALGGAQPAGAAAAFGGGASGLANGADAVAASALGGILQGGIGGAGGGGGQTTRGTDGAAGQDPGGGGGGGGGARNGQSRSGNGGKGGNGFISFECV